MFTILQNQNMLIFIKLLYLQKIKIYYCENQLSIDCLINKSIEVKLEPSSISCIFSDYPDKISALSDLPSW